MNKQESKLDKLTEIIKKMMDQIQISNFSKANMPPIVFEAPPSNGGAFLLARTAVEGYWAFG